MHQYRVHFDPLACSFTGEGAPSIARQGTIIDQGMTTLLSGAASAIATITHMKLDVRRTRTNLHQDIYFSESPASSPDFPCKSQDITLMPYSALSLLAAAVLRLQHLYLHTICCDVDVAAFGAHCPQLSHLYVESDSAPLQGVHLALPGLTHLRLTRSNPCWRHVEDCASTREYVETACTSLHSCTSLTSLELCLDLSCVAKVDCPSEMWNQLPASLVEWHCQAEFPHIFEAKLFMGRVKVLSLGRLPTRSGGRVQALLKLAPMLKDLTVSEWQLKGYQLELMWSPETLAAELLSIKERLLGGFKLSCEKVSLTGTCVAVRDMLAWHSPLEDTVSCCVHLTGTSRLADGLHKLARTLPRVEYLFVRDDYHMWEEAQWMSEGLVTAVSGCKQMKRFDIDLSVAFTHAGLVGMCMGLPALETLYCRPCEGMSFQGVVLELAKRGRAVSIVEIVEGVDVPAAFEY